MRHVIVSLGEDGYWAEKCRSLWGCVSQAKTREAASRYVREAIQEYLYALEEDHLHIPPEIPEQKSLKILRRDSPFAQVVIPDREELHRGTLCPFLRQLDIGIEPFVRLIK